MTVIRQVAIPLPQIDLLLWLENQTLFPKVYWQDRDGKSVIAGLGKSLSFSGIPEHPCARLFGGITFAEKGWEGIPESSFFLPTFEIEQKAGKTTLRINAPEPLPSLESLLSLNFSLNPAPAPAIQLIHREDTPTLTQWKERLTHYLTSIKNEELHKIVCARRTRLIFENTLNPFFLLKKLKDKAHNATVFLFQWNKESTFLGATPEKLYQRKKDLIRSDMMAATRPRSSDEREDASLKQELLSDPKERREFNSVKDFILSSLAPLCTSFDKEQQDRIVTTTTVHHLFNSFSGKLKPGTSDRTLINLLHPTPAVGGYPQEKAMRLLREEPFCRGYYAAPIGWISPEEADISVGIRSALLQNRELHLFAGTGIVEGSNPDREWEELEYKIAPFLNIIYE
jgi:menaquinone-specific isochorismate synthase